MLYRGASVYPNRLLCWCENIKRYAFGNLWMNGWQPSKIRWLIQSIYIYGNRSVPKVFLLPTQHPKTSQYRFSSTPRFPLPRGTWNLPKMTRTGIEPMLPPWKGGVLAAWPPSHIGFYDTHKTALCSNFVLYLLSHGDARDRMCKCRRRIGDC